MNDAQVRVAVKPDTRIVWRALAGLALLDLAMFFDVLIFPGVACSAPRRRCAPANPLLVLPAEMQVAVKTSSIGSELVSFTAWVADVVCLCRGTQFDPQLAFSEARRLLASAPPDRPLFLWVHLFPPHDPYITSGPFWMN